MRITNVNNISLGLPMTMNGEGKCKVEIELLFTGHGFMSSALLTHAPRFRHGEGLLPLAVRVALFRTHFS